MIELCAGSARLTATLSALGFGTMAMDQKMNRHKQCHPTICLDLANEETVNYLQSFLNTPGYVFYIHAAPPCGTCSRARERKLARHLKALGAKEPQPLRSPQHPHGLPNLCNRDKLRVDTANAIYQNVAAILTKQCRRGPSFPSKIQRAVTCGILVGWQTSFPSTSFRL